MAHPHELNPSQLVNGGTAQLSLTGLEDANLVITNKEGFEQAVSQVSSGIDSKIQTAVDKASRLAFEGGMYLFRKGVPVQGFEDVSQSPSYRINSLVQTKKGTILAFSDYRQGPQDELGIVPILARSENGGQTFEYIRPVDRDKTSGWNANKSRAMDPTVIYDTRDDSASGGAGNGVVWLLLGSWKKGNQNWCANNGDTANNWTGAILAKSIDDGKTWTRQTIGKAGCDIVIQNLPQGCKGFLGGVGCGIVASDGKLVFPVQYTKGQGDVHTTIIYSEDKGVTWKFGTGNCDSASGGTFSSGEHMVIEVEPGKIVSMSRFAGSNSNGPRRAFVTTDWGNTWSVYKPYDKKIPYGDGCQGSSIKIATKAGNKVVICSATTGHINGSPRSGLTIYAFKEDANNPDNAIAIPLHSINIPQSGGYSTLSYLNTRFGEKLLLIYECQDVYPTGSDPKSQKLKDLSFLIPAIDNIASSTTLNAVGDMDMKLNQINEKIDGIITKPQETDETVKTEYTSEGLRPSSRALIDSVGDLTLGWDASTNDNGISLSETTPGMMFLKNQGGDVSGIEIKTNLPEGHWLRTQPVGTGISVSFKFKMTDTNLAVTDNWAPIFGISNGRTSNTQDIKLGFGIQQALVNGHFKLEIYGMPSSGGNNVLEHASLVPNKELNLVLTWKNREFKMYVDGTLVGTKTASANMPFGELRTILLGTHNKKWKSCQFEFADLKIHNKCLEQAEVNKLLEATSTKEYLKDVGDLSKLQTSAKTSIVDAINELKASAGVAGPVANPLAGNIKNSYKLEQLQSSSQELGDNAGTNPIKWGVHGSGNGLENSSDHESTRLMTLTNRGSGTGDRIMIKTDADESYWLKTHPIATGFSVSMKFRMTSDNLDLTDNWAPIFAFTSASEWQPTQFLGFGVQNTKINGDKLKLELYGFGSTQTHDCTKLKVDTVHQLVMTWKNNQFKLYVDGQLELTKDKSGNFNLSILKALYLGTHEAKSKQTKFEFGDLIVYDKCLEEGELSNVGRSLAPRSLSVGPSIVDSQSEVKASDLNEGEFVLVRL